MKSTLAISLILAILCSVTINAMSSNRKRKAYIAFHQRGYLRIVDVGSNLSTTWSCGTNGRVYKHLPNDNDRKAKVYKHMLDCSRIDVSRDGKPWVVSRNGNIWRLDADKKKANRFRWIKLPGCARDIGCGHGNTCFVIGCEKTKYGGGIYKWNGSNWEKTGDGLATRIDAGSKNLYVVNGEGTFFKSTNGGENWTPLQGQFIDVAVGANDSVYATSPKGSFQLVKGKFYQINPFGKSISAGNFIWIVGGNNIAYRGRLNKKYELTKSKREHKLRRGFRSRNMKLKAFTSSQQH